MGAGCAEGWVQSTIYVIATEGIFNNHGRIAEEQEFVCHEVAKLLSCGAVTELGKNLMVCNPLGVVKNSQRKPRLIVDLRYVNQHLRSHKFKYEDIRTVADLFFKGDWFFKFDYKNGYHHIEILPQHCQFLGFSLFFGGKLRFSQFTVLPFGLSVGPYLFTFRFEEHLSSTGGVKASEYLHTWMMGLVQTKC